MAVEQFANNASTTLNGAIDNVQTSVPVHTVTTFPASPQFRILVDSELMLVNSIAGSTFTVTRGVEGTAAVTHADAATVTHVLTSGGLVGVAGSVVMSDVTANIPTPGIVGRLYLPQDGFHLYRDTGSSWQAYAPLATVTPPNDSQFTWFNQSSQSATGTVTVLSPSGAIFLNVPSQTGGNEQFRAREVVITSGYTLTACLLIHGYPANFWSAGLMLRDSVGGALITFKLGFATQANMEIGKANADFSFNSDYQNSHLSDWPYSPQWFRIQDDTINRLFFISPDGKNFTKLFSVSRTDFITPTRAGFVASADNAVTPTTITVLSWSLTYP